MAETPKRERTSAAEEVRRIRSELIDAGIAARRTMERIRLARVIIVATAQAVILFVLWRISVRRARRRRQLLMARLGPQ
jgi:hypothetical protein